MEKHITETERDLERWEEQVKQHKLRLKEYEELIARRSSIEEGYAQLAQARKLNDELDQRFRLVTTLNERKHQLEITIMQAGEALVTEHALAQNQIKELEASSQKLPQLKNELQQLQTQLSRLAEQEETLHKKRQTSQELLTQIHYLESSKTRLEQEIAEIQEKLNLLLTESGARCPLCETELGMEGLKLIQTKYTADKQSKSDSLESNQTELAHQKIELESVVNEISQLEANLNQDKASAQGKASILSKSIAEAEEAGNKLNEGRTRLAEIEQHLASKDFAPSEQQTLHRLEDELAKLDYNPQQHEQVRQRLIDLEQYEAPKQKLEEADRLINQEKEALSSAEEAGQERHHRLEVDNQKGRS